MTSPYAMPDDPLDRAFRGYFAHEMAGLDAPPRGDNSGLTPAARRAPRSRRGEWTLALSVGLGLAAALTLLPTPDGRTRSRPRAATPGTSLLEGATADGSRLPASK